MGIDLEKLTAAPWFASAVGEPQVWHDAGDIHAFVCDTNASPDMKRGDSQADAEFIALARNAFDVMMRRGWYPVATGEVWRVWGRGGVDIDLNFIAFGPNHGRFPDPFTALVEADKWYTANVELPPGTAAAGA